MSPSPSTMQIEEPERTLDGTSENLVHPPSLGSITGLAHPINMHIASCIKAWTSIQP